MDDTAAQLLAQLRQFDESERIEAKRASAIGDSILETICAFSNEPGLGGGWLLLGIEKASDKPGDYRVAGIENTDHLLNDLHSRCANAFNVPIRVRARAEEVEGKTVIVVEVPEAESSSRPIYLRNKPLPRSAWRRGLNGDFRCNQDDLAVLYQLRSGQSFDASPVTGAGLDDIDEDALEEYRRARSNVNPIAEELNYSDHDLLEALAGAVRVQGQLRPTVAGVLLFGRRAAVRRLFPGTRVDYIRMPGKEWVEDPDSRFTTLDMRDTLPRLVQRASAAVLDDLPRAFQLPEGALRRGEQPLLPAKVVREAIVNALMHRNYQRHQPVQILRFSNRLEIRNPGYSLKALELLGEPGSEWRNPVIASVLHEMGYAETKGSGIRVMRRLMEDSGLTPPSFDSDRHADRFAATYLFHHFLGEQDIEWLGRFQDYGLEEDERRALVFVRETGRITNSDYRDLNRVDTLSASQHLGKLRDFGLLEQVPKGAATYYVPGPELPISGEDDAQPGLFDQGVARAERLSKESRGEVGGLSQESPGLSQESPGLSQESGGARKALLAELPDHLRKEVQELGQRTRDPGKMHQVLVSLCGHRAYKASELALLVNRGSHYLQTHYLKPLLKEGHLEYQFPEEPNRPDQAYKMPEHLKK